MLFLEFLFFTKNICFISEEAISLLFLKIKLKELGLVFF